MKPAGSRFVLADRARLGAFLFVAAVAGAVLVIAAFMFAFGLVPGVAEHR